MAQAGLAAGQKGARRSGRALAFLDETGHSFRARLSPTWARVGHPPVLKRLTRRREISTVACLVAPLDRPARLYARHFRGSVHGAQVVVALRYFRRRIGQPLVVLWDRSQAHRAAVVRDFVATHPADYRLEWLPPYAPELNPEELCNGAAKRQTLNAAPASVDELHRQARRAFRRLGRRPPLLTGSFHHAGLALPKQREGH